MGSKPIYSTIINTHVFNNPFPTQSPMRKRDGHTKDKISDIMKFSPDTVYLSDKKLYIYRVTHRSQFFLNHNFTALSCNKVNQTL